MVDTNKVCPECGADLSKFSLLGHMLTHYPEHLDPARSSKLAIKRQKQILEGGVSKETYLKEHTEE